MGSGMQKRTGLLPSLLQGRLDFVTVTFAVELRLLQLQAHSFQRFVPVDLVNTICLIVNEPQDEAEAVVESIKTYVLPLYGDHQKNVRIFTQGDLVGDHTFTHQGWYSQQVLKLAIARILKDDAYIVLDSKNHFVAPVGWSTFVSDTGILKHHLLDMRPKFQDKVKQFIGVQKPKPMPRRCVGSFRYFGLSPQDYASAMVPTTTPFPLYTNVSKQLLAYVEEQEKHSFSAWFEHYYEATEFYLSYAFMLVQGLAPSEIYSQSAKTGVLLFKEVAQKENLVQEKLAAFSNRNLVCFGIHRTALGQLSDTSRKAIGNFWVARNLIIDDELTHYFMSQGVLHSVVPEIQPNLKRENHVHD